MHAHVPTRTHAYTLALSHSLSHTLSHTGESDIAQWMPDGKQATPTRGASPREERARTRTLPGAGYTDDKARAAHVNVADLMADTSSEDEQQGAHSHANEGGGGAAAGVAGGAGKRKRFSAAAGGGGDVAES